MDCKYCGGPTDDPMWDDVCDECEHELTHTIYFEPNCGFCIADAEDQLWYYGDVAIEDEALA